MLVGFQSKSPSFKHVKQSFHQLSMQWHPDKVSQRFQRNGRLMTAIEVSQINTVSQSINDLFAVAEKFALEIHSIDNTPVKDVIIPAELVLQSDKDAADRNHCSAIAAYKGIVVVSSGEDDCDSQEFRSYPSPQPAQNSRQTAQSPQPDPTANHPHMFDGVHDGPASPIDPNREYEVDMDYFINQADRLEEDMDECLNDLRDRYNNNDDANSNDANSNELHEEIEECVETEDAEQNEKSDGDQIRDETERKVRRRILRGLYNSRRLGEAKEALMFEESMACSWLPRRVCNVSIVGQGDMDTRWECERAVREHAAYLAPPRGIRVHKTAEVVEMRCRNVANRCPAYICYRRRKQTGIWALTTFTDHIGDCVSGFLENDKIRTSTSITSAYTAEQISRIIHMSNEDVAELTAKQIASIIRGREIYSKLPDMRFFREVRRIIHDSLTIRRAEQMASLPQLQDALQNCGHQLKVYTASAEEMRETRVKSALFIFQQAVKGGFLQHEDVFDENDVDVSDIKEGENYYSGFLFVPSVASTLVKSCRMTCSADAAHCQGVGVQSYGTILRCAVYDANNHLNTICFAHFVGTESRELWGRVFEAVKEVHGFDISRRVMVTDQEKGIDSAFDDVFGSAKQFYDMMHVKKNMLPTLGCEKSTAPYLLKQAIWAPTKSMCDGIIAKFGPKQAAYLGRFCKSRLYRSYAGMEDIVTTSQGAESQMRAAITNRIRSTEPQQMVWNLLRSTQKRLMQRKERVLKFDKPVPAHIEEHIAKLIEDSKPYQNTVNFLDNTDMMQATVASRKDCSVLRHVIINEPGRPPFCCVYSRSGNGFPCLHGIAAICVKHDSSHVYKYIDQRHTTQRWKEQYHNLSFDLPTQEDVDTMVEKARQSILNGTSIRIPVAIPPPRGRPPKTASKRLKSWYERGPTSGRKRQYSCALCGESGHRRNKCARKQSFHSDVEKQAAGIASEGAT